MLTVLWIWRWPAARTGVSNTADNETGAVEVLLGNGDGHVSKRADLRRGTRSTS